MRLCLLLSLLVACPPIEPPGGEAEPLKPGPETLGEVRLATDPSAVPGRGPGDQDLAAPLDGEQPPPQPEPPVGDDPGPGPGVEGGPGPEPSDGLGGADQPGGDPAEGHAPYHEGSSAQVLPDGSDGNPDHHEAQAGAPGGEPVAGGDGTPPPDGGEGEPVAPPDGAPDPTPKGVGEPDQTRGKPVGDTFNSLIGTGDIITISGLVDGADTAQVDFIVPMDVGGTTVPLILHAEPVKAGTFVVEAPARYDGPIYVTVLVDEDGDGPGPNDPRGALADPIRLEGQDIQLELKVGTTADWQQTVFPPPPGGPPGPPSDGPPSPPPE